MTADDIRRMALDFPETSESSHQGLPDLRGRCKTFSTRGYPGDDWAMVKLTPEQQECTKADGRRQME